MATKEVNCTNGACNNGTVKCGHNLLTAHGIQSHCEGGTFSRDGDVLACPHNAPAPHLYQSDTCDGGSTCGTCQGSGTITIEV